ncbi:DNA-formamidopyrimidine glycosylase [Stratiformator vulcanicus]|uniref:Formamidopyrimidine-DNA glycosylase n=1 Tax=Stratiformator vulcanicus TaxID=2527980 RepID=A0A517QW72_9PLAN|nr:DNA-formamidopyrimidine glycosylase [Stratiformator vulcanicus]QDT35891.1 Formamidopyrimidine-DNA glycosylase [Stratiformator vulcanicus]
MPELPEVETMVRGIRPHVAGRVITRVERCRCRYRPIDVTPSMRQIARRATGRTIVEVARRAKRILLKLDSGDCFAIEPRMTGLMLVDAAPDRSHLRIRWRLDDGNDLWFWDRRGLGTLRLYTPDEYEAALGPDRLGPEPLDMSTADWKQRLTGRSREIKVALLDQKLVAGIGNLYAAEILHAARIDPRRRTEGLSGREIGRIAARAIEILNEAIRYEGSTLSDGTYRNAINGEGRYQNEHRVYGRAGQPCGSCGKATIVRIVQAQRATFYCPKCQR